MCDSGPIWASDKINQHQNSKTICSLIYSPLNKSRREIRLINILPDPEPSSDIHCELFTVSLDSRPYYNALSYVWGFAGDTSTIILNEHPFTITKNLNAALRSLRSPYHEVRIWADAVCINQRDDRERGHQIELMCDIYRSTRRTFVWLGDLEESSTDHYSGDCFTWSGDLSDGPQNALVLSHIDKDSKLAGPKAMFCALSLLAQHDLHLSVLGQGTASGLPLWFWPLHRLMQYSWVRILRKRM